MKTTFFNPLLLIGLIGFFTLGSSLGVDLYRAFWGDRNIYWTHAAMPLSLEDTANDFQIDISGKRLQRHLTDGTLQARDANGASYPVVAKDVRVRVNHWPSVQSGILIKAVFTSFAFGAALTMLIVGWIMARREKKSSDG